MVRTSLSARPSNTRQSSWSTPHRPIVGWPTRRSTSEARLGETTILANGLVGYATSLKDEKQFDEAHRAIDRAIKILDINLAISAAAAATDRDRAA